MQDICAIIPAAGSGSRAGFEGNKLLQKTGGIPVLKRTVAAFSECAQIAGICVCVRGEERAEIEPVALSYRAYEKKRAEMQAELQDEVMKRKAIQAQLDPADLEIYKKVRKENIRLPIMVEYVGGTCRGCGMHVENDLRGKIVESGDVAECPNCRRILYLK